MERKIVDVPFRFILLRIIEVVGIVFFGLIPFCILNWASSVFVESKWAIDTPPLISLYYSVPGTFVSILLFFHCYFIDTDTKDISEDGEDEDDEDDGEN